jgi:hypothetical protein
MAANAVASSASMFTSSLAGDWLTTHSYSSNCCHKTLTNTAAPCYIASAWATHRTPLPTVLLLHHVAIAQTTLGTPFLCYCLHPLPSNGHCLESLFCKGSTWNTMTSRKSLCLEHNCILQQIWCIYIKNMQTSLNAKSTFFWVVITCSLKTASCSRGTYCLHLRVKGQARKEISKLATGFRWFLAWLTLPLWRWRRYVPPKHESFPTIHGVTTHKTVTLFMATTVSTSNSPNMFRHVLHAFKLIIK